MLDHAKRSCTRVRVLLVLTALCVSALPSRSLAAPRMLVEISHRDHPETVPREVRADAHFLIDILVRTDGTWEAGGRRGQLSPRDRAALTRAVNRARLQLDTTPRPTCAAIPNQVSRVRTRRGTLTWLAPCSREPEATTSALVELTYALTNAPAQAPPDEPTPPDQAPPTSNEEIVRYERTSMEDIADGERLVLFADGRVEGLGRPARVSPDQLREIERLARTTVVAAVPRDRAHVCAAMLTGQASIRVRDRGSYSWSTPCGQPDPSIHALLARIRALAASE